MKIKTALQPLGLLLAALFFSLNMAQAATYTWTGTSGGSWGANTNWLTSSGTWPGAGDTAVVSNTTGVNQVVWYDAPAVGTTGSVATLNIVQEASGTNQVNLIRNLTVANTIVLGSTDTSINGVSMLYIDPVDTGTVGTATPGRAVYVTANVNLYNNGILAMSTTGTDPATGYNSTLDGNVTMSGGLLIQYNDPVQTKQNSAVCTIKQNLTMTGGTLVIGGSLSGAVVYNGTTNVSASANTSYWDPRFTVNGTVNITGGVVAASKGTLVLGNSGSNWIMGLSSSNSYISQVMMSGGNQSFISDSTGTNAYIGRIIARGFASSGTNTKYIGSSISGGTLAIGYLDFGQGNINATSAVKLTSNVVANSTSTQIIGLGFASGSAGTIGLTLDLNGYNFMGTSTGTTTGHVSMNNNSTSNPSLWTIQNSGVTTSTLAASYFAFSASTVNVGVNSLGSIVLSSIGVGGTNNLGSSTSGTITANTLFSYIGSGTSYLTSGRMIGGLSVGTGSNASTLVLLSNITTGTGSSVTINNGATLSVGAYTLALTPASSATISIGQSATFDVSGLGTAGYTVQSGVNIFNNAGTVKGSLNLGTGGTIAMMTTGTGNQYNALISSNLTMSDGQLILYRAASYGMAGSYNVSGNFTMTGGTVSIGLDNGGLCQDNRFYVAGNANISGGQIVNSSFGGLFLNGATNSIANLTSPFTGGVTLGGGNQTYVVDDVSISGTSAYTIRATSSGTVVKSVGSTTGHTLSIGSLAYGQQGLGTTILRLTSNITTTLGGAVLSNWGVSGTTVGYGIDTNSLTLNLNSLTSGFVPNNVNSTTLINWYLQNTGTSGAGTISALSFDFSKAAQVNVGGNAANPVILLATGTATNNLGTGTSGIITADTLFSYIGNGSGSLSSGRMIGGLSVGDGTSNSLLNLTSSITTGSGSPVTVNAGANLALGNNNLYLTPAPTTAINLARTGTISGASGALYLNSGVNLNLTGTAGMAAVTSNVNLSGTVTFANTHVTGTDLLMSGNIVDGTAAGAIVVNGPQVTAFTGGASTYSGGMTLNGGTTYLANKGAGIGALAVNGTGGANTLAQLTGNLSGFSSLTLSGTTNSSGILETGNYSLTPSSGLITINSGGILQTSAYIYSYISATTSTIVVNDGGTLRTALTVGTSAVENNVGSVILNSGATLTTSTSATLSSGGRIAVYGNFTANAGSTINTNDSAGGYLALYGTSATIAEGVTLTTPGNGVVNTIAMVRGSGTQVLQSGVNLGRIYLRDNDAGLTNSVKILRLTGTATTVNSIFMTNSETIASGMTNTLQLGSNIICLGVLDSTNYTSIGRVVVDLSGYTLTLSTAGWAPDISTTNSSPWTIASSSGTGVFQARYFNLSSTNTDVTVGANVVMQATLAGGTSELGLKATSGSGTISAASTFLYAATGTHTLKTTVARNIGNVQVGDGTVASTLALGSNINTDLSSQVNVQAGATLDLQGHTLSTGGVNIGNGANLAGSGVVSAPVNVNGGSIKSNGVSMGDTTFHGTSSVVGSATASNMTVADGATTVSGNATATNTFTVSAGAQLTNTGTTGANTVSVINGATLTNNGTLNGTVNVSGLLNGTGTIKGALTIKTNGELAPGNSPGITTVAGNLTVETGAKISMQIEGITAAGTDYDQIVVTGASSLVSLNAGSILSLSIADGVFTNGALTLIENQSDNAIVGTFSSVVIGGNTYDVSTTNKFTYGGKEYELLYNVNADGGTTANDFELTVVPEPGTWAMLVGGLGMLLGAQRMRRRSA